MDREALLDIAARVRGCTRCRLATTRTCAVPGEGGGVFGHAATLSDFGAAPADMAGSAAPAEMAGSTAPAEMAGSTASGAGMTQRFSGVMLVGEAPGRNEDETGRPFCGAAGKNLDRALAAAGLAREAVFVTSINKCRPPDNRDPKGDEKAACRPYLLEQIQALSPRLIVALGRHGLSGLVEDPPKSFSAVRGTFVAGPSGPDGRPIPVFCSLHPAAIIYRQQWKEAYLDDWARLGRWLRGMPVEGFPAPA